MITASHSSLLALVLLASCAKANVNESGGSEADAQVEVRIDAAISIRPDAQACPGDPCQILPQCGCSQGACDIDTAQFETGGTICREVAMPGREDSACGSLLECDIGYVCLGGQCRSYCDDQNPCSDGQCLVEPVYDSGGGVFEPIPGIIACTKDCDPEKSVDNGCPASPQFGCHLVNYDPTPGNDGDEFYYGDCRTAPATGGGDGADCTDTGDPGCQPGFECIGLGDATVCKQLCLTPNGPCGTGTCSSFGTPVLIGAIEYGVCL